MRKAFHGYILIAPVMIGCLVFTLIPFGIVLRYSFTQGYGAAGMFVGMEHYTKMFQNDLFRLAFFNTMKFLAIGLPLIMLLSYLLALLMQKQAGKHKLLKSVFLFPYIMPVAGTVLLIDLLFGEKGARKRLVCRVKPAHRRVAERQIRLLGHDPHVPLEKHGVQRYSAARRARHRPRGAVRIRRSRRRFGIVRSSATSPRRKCGIPCFSPLIFSVINAFKCFREIFLDRRRAPGG